MKTYDPNRVQKLRQRRIISLNWLSFSRRGRSGGKASRDVLSRSVKAAAMIITQGLKFICRARGEKNDPRLEEKKRTMRAELPGACAPEIGNSL